MDCQRNNTRPEIVLGSVRTHLQRALVLEKVTQTGTNNAFVQDYFQSQDYRHWCTLARWCMRDLLKANYTSHIHPKKRTSYPLSAWTEYCCIWLGVEVAGPGANLAVTPEKQPSSATFVANRYSPAAHLRVLLWCVIILCLLHPHTLISQSHFWRS